MARIHSPITSFGNELQAVLRAGADRRIEITFDRPALATRFKQRIHALRDAMKKADHPDWKHLYRCGVYPDPTNKCKITIGPKDAEFRQALLDAGLTGIDDPSPVTAVEITSEPGTVDDFLSDLTSVTSVQNVLNEDTDEPNPDPQQETDLGTL